LEAEREIHDKSKKELEAKVSTMTAELRTAKSTKAKDGKDKTAAELKDLKTENDTLTGSVQKLEADLLKKNAQVSELESEFETEKTSA